MNTFTVARRLTTAFGAIILVFMLVGGVALYSATQLADANKWNTHTYKVLALGDEMLESMINMETGARGFLIASEDRYLEPWNSGNQAFEKSWAEVKGLTSDNPTQQKRLDEMKKRYEEFTAVGKTMIQFRRDVSSGQRSSTDFVAEFKQGRDKAAMDSFRGLHAEFDKAERDLLVVRDAAAARYQSLNRNVVIFGSLLAVLIAAGLGIWVTRAITGQLGGEPDYAANVAKQIAEGNLMVDVQVKTGDTASLLAVMRDMRDSLVKVVSRVRQGAEAVSTASAEIAQGNADLSSRTESQASSLEETAASMEELGSTVKQNADNSRQANQLAQGASTVAIKGGEVVAQVVSTMQGINDSSRRIADIINVIDGIAFQTNILALNAAVEAARAGEQGRGFAVVAGEVRNLAGRSADAAKEIKQLITESVGRVEQGTSLVDEAGRTMDEVVASIKRVTDIMGEISAASVEQSAGVGQVGEAVTNMDQVTQQNAALVEEMSAAASSLNTQAQDLVQVVAVFKLNAGQTPATPKATPVKTSNVKPFTVVSTANLKATKTTKTPQPQNTAALTAPSAKPSEPRAEKSSPEGDNWESF
ncbi:chemotaxis protein [Hylemonella gracilis str. Niagara R]|uniref:Chemotaxis protein n=1 Tax=Hylemonella gracilis str. Niagara R TaxID=1458275 RepID=A0A016XLC9_9BURK|nr:methyl-accepting chemotaxis protein [Hylemonella gracilis]EYC52705.1 chemotaxis protein [Hylemonella gracilis str. Niagara R]